MWKHIASNTLTASVVVVAMLAGVALWARNAYYGLGPLEAPICLSVARGATMDQVAQNLQAQGAISSAAIFRIGTDYGGQAKQLKAGSFLLEAGGSMADIAAALTHGGASTCGAEIVYRIGVTRFQIQLRRMDLTTRRYGETAAFDPDTDPPPAALVQAQEEAATRYRITVAEGATNWQVLARLEAIQALAGAVGSAPPEGMLAPGSYEFRAGEARAAIVARMQAKQQARLAAAWEARSEDTPLQSPQDLLTLASIIERETGLPAERKAVAGVFVNRLRRGMRLQADPTVRYGITEGKAPLGRGLRQSELQRKTPWNTYVIDGLPPTPIANPGQESLAAAAQPEKTAFLYFVADGNGGHVFAKTLHEHNRNVARWRRIQAEQRSD
ncbi:MAG: endolytic transglycosylase MltG [Rhodobacteraceae bacterium]|nr:endolytic transglycosylase MltG [Paracoccaceae bacterium]